MVGSSATQLKFFKFDFWPFFSVSTNSLKLPDCQNLNLDFIPCRGEVGSSWEEADHGSEEVDVIPEIQNNGN